jgi:hypothetical protein
VKKQELEALVSRLQGLVPEDDGTTIEDEKVTDAVHAAAQVVYQEIYDRGHQFAHAKGKGVGDDLQKRLDASEKAREKAEKEAAELAAKAPDLEKIRGEHKAQLDDLRTAHQSELDEERGKGRKASLDRRIQDLRLDLVRLGVDPDYAEVLVSKPDTVARFRPAEDGAIEILQKGKDVPFAPGGETTPIQLLAAELKEGAPDKFITASGDRGSGSRSGQGSQSSGFDLGKYREDLLKQRQEEAAKRQSGMSSLKERLGGRPAT